MTKAIQQQLERAQDFLRFAGLATISEQRDDYLQEARQCLNLALSMLQDLELKLRSLDVGR
ncbi:MAG TPA: hypothetical protein VFZ08_00125 [Terriglobia bacterium]|nr:hypothetical protein [Terriglobia bacterium]